MLKEHIFLKNQLCFMSMRADELERKLGLKTYIDKYKEDSVPEDQLFNELQEWFCRVPTKKNPLEADDYVSIICCPEDVTCKHNCGVLETRTLCEHCTFPACSTCWRDLNQARLPPLALANDMWIGFAPRALYQKNVTILEMICASPCLTSMICFSMEIKYGNMFNSDVHMQRHRVGARGNVTCFPLPWEELLVQLEGVGDEGPKLPRIGQELVDVVQILLKSSKSENIDLSHVIHQARIRRAVVVDLILSARERGHPAYKSLDKEQVEERAKGLPEDGVPEDLLRELSNDDSIDKLQPQKADTPVAGRVDVSRVSEVLLHARPHAVVNERCGADCIDLNEQYISAMQHAVEEPQLGKGPRKVAQQT